MSKKRRDLVQSGYIDAIIDLPGGLLSMTSLPASLIICSARQLDRDEVLFIDARRQDRLTPGKPSELPMDETTRISTSVARWRFANFEAEPTFSNTATLDQIEQNGWNLSPNLYVEYVEAIDKIDGEPIVDRALALREQLWHHRISLIDFFDDLIAGDKFD